MMSVDQAFDRVRVIRSQHQLTGVVARPRTKSGAHVSDSGPATGQPDSWLADDRKSALDWRTEAKRPLADNEVSFPTPDRICQRSQRVRRVLVVAVRIHHHIRAERERSAKPLAEGAPQAEVTPKFDDFRPAGPGDVDGPVA